MVERKMEKSMEEMDLEYIANSDLEWSKYKNKTIFVTGATGLIGSLLVKAFAYYNCLHQGNIKTVSYTHLDVYKRQASEPYIISGSVK